jgi:hypothetical protein
MPAFVFFNADGAINFIDCSRLSIYYQIFIPARRQGVILLASCCFNSFAFFPNRAILASRSAIAS